ncbi:endogenous retrovirus group PABLB member 1 Env polyprotein-like [Moschus berezovskii]|uniref:endogenous retrovirus group PABLB member 1 Env polyprotein-like n=1 Tax=Moschus berezovskii TaxID=68408 RepID=UPI002444C354|nr:endogenous retrovirus group PABLB member 1 Env polyprotein-like [Moschus berezovskii]
MNAAESSSSSPTTILISLLLLLNQIGFATADKSSACPAFGPGVYLLALIVSSSPFSSEGNVFLSWAHSYADFHNSSACWVCTAMPLSVVDGFPWWVSPIQQMHFPAVCDFLIQYKQSHRSLINLNVSALPECNDMGHQKASSSLQFNVNVSYKTVKDAYHTYSINTNKNKTRSSQFFGDYYQIWDEYFWMTPEKRQLLRQADICWEQREHQPHFGGKDFGKHLLKHVGITPTSMCTRVTDVTFNCNVPTLWPRSNWENSPGIRWVAPNGTKWICGSNVWPWLPLGWVGRCSLGFVFAPGRITRSTIKNPANLPLLKARWSRSVFHWYDYLTAVFVPSLGNADIMAHVDALTNFTQQALLDAKRAIEALNEEQKQMRKAVLQNQMALDILTAAQRGTCAVIKVECCVYIPDLSSNVSDAVNDIKEQIEAMQDSSVPFWEQVKSWFHTDW